MGDLNNKFIHFQIQPVEKVCTGIDRLNMTTQKMTQHGQLPTPNPEELLRLNYFAPKMSM